MPVLRERDLHGNGGGTAYLHMGIAPVADLFVFSQILIPHIQAAYPCGLPIDDNHFSVVAEIELKTISFSLLCMKTVNLYTRILQVSFVGIAQAVAAYLIIEKMDLHSLFGFCDKSGFELTAYLIIFHNVELKEDILLRIIQPLYEISKESFSVDEQIHSVMTQEGEVRQF